MAKIREILEKHNSEIKIDENTDWEYTFFCIKESDFDKLEAELNSLDKWISVEDELPKDIKSVLVYYQNRMITISAYLEKLGWWRIDGYCSEITHWQPLPQPPKEQK